jgi:hypothetical protein
VDGTRLDLDRFRFAFVSPQGVASPQGAASVPDWSGSLAFPEADLDMSAALAVKGRLEMHASDSRPLAAFISAKKPLKGWERNLITVEEIVGRTQFALAGQTLEIDDFSIAGGHIEVKARLKVNHQGAFGKVLARYKAVKAGVAFKGKDRDLHVLRPEHWYEQD